MEKEFNTQKGTSLSEMICEGILGNSLSVGHVKEFIELLKEEFKEDNIANGRIWGIIDKLAGSKLNSGGKNGK